MPCALAQMYQTYPMVRCKPTLRCCATHPIDLCELRAPAALQPLVRMNGHWSRRSQRGLRRLCWTALPPTLMWPWSACPFWGPRSGRCFSPSSTATRWRRLSHATPDQTIHGLLEHWAAATPDAPAVIYEVLFMAALCSLMSAAPRSRFMHCRHVRVRCQTGREAGTYRARC